MLPIFYGEVPGATPAPPACRPDESGSSRSGPELTIGTADGRDNGTKKKRILTEARKEQNRAAQRLFSKTSVRNEEPN